MERRERERRSLKRAAKRTLPKQQNVRNSLELQQPTIKSSRILHISDDESSIEEFKHQNNQNASKFHSNNKTMPKFNQSQVSFSLTRQQQQTATGIPLMKSIQTMNVARKVPPAPPKRKIFRTDPEGMPVIAEFNEKKNIQLTSVALPAVTTNPKPRVPPKPLITFVGQQRKQQNLLNQMQLQQKVYVAITPNVNLNNSNLTSQPNLHHQPLQTIHSNLITNHRPKQQLKPQQQHYVPKSSTGGKSDPENHIYEMIDDYEKNNCNLQQVSNHRPTIEDADETKDRMNMFEDLLRAEMRTQMQSCSKKLNAGGFLSHLTQEKRMDIIQETALSIASATYLEKAAQRMVSAGNGTKSSRTSHGNGADRGGFCGAIQRAPPIMPPSLARRLSNKENMGFGRVKVMLRVCDNPPSTEGEKNVSHLSIDKKKRQVTLSEPMPTQTTQPSTSNAQDRALMVSAPKMFAFDALHTSEDSQIDVCASALSEVIPAVLEGSDGCLLAIGYPGAGQNRTMLGSVTSSVDLGAIPCAITWLYKGINEKRQKSGARFSVRVSALGINATKPGSKSKDLLAALATESDESPGMYLRDDYLGGPTELRAPTAERAALFLDAALAGRTSSIYEPALIFTLHVYQYSLAGKGGVAGGRSRLHLIDLGGCANRSGGLPLSGVGNVVLSILSGQKHPPNREHPLTPLLKDCLAPLTCHVAIMAHVSHSQTHADSLTTIQLASRIHRLRRRKHRFPLSGDKSGSGNPQSGSSSGPDPSSSDFSADTVIYVGPCPDDATDNEHPPVFLPNLNSGDNRCAMSKVLKGSAVEKNVTKSPVKKSNSQKLSQAQSSPLHHKTDSLKRNQSKMSIETATNSSNDHSTTVYAQVVQSTSLTKITSNTGSLKHTSKGSNFPTPKNSPMRRNPTTTHESPKRITEEKWIDGPRVSKLKVAEARHLMREINHVKQRETWIDGPNIKPLSAVKLPNANQSQGYGYMDTHKRSMIRQWVENQTTQILQTNTTSTSTTTTTNSLNTPVQYHQYYKTIQKELMQQPQCFDDDRNSVNSRTEDILNPVDFPAIARALYSEHFGRASSKKLFVDHTRDTDEQDHHSERSSSYISESRQLMTATGGENEEEEDQDSGPSEVPPALPLIEPLGSRDVSRQVSRQVSHESLCQNVMMMDCALQVTEDDIARAMGGREHPLSALSNGDISVVSSFNVGDTFSECVIGDNIRNQFDQLARLRELFTSQLAMAEVIPASFRVGDSGSVYSEPAFRFNAGPGSVCSEPVYRVPSPNRCRDCRQSISRTPSETSLPSLNGIMAINTMEPYASLRHPDGASDPNIKKSLELLDAIEKKPVEINVRENPLADIVCETDLNDIKIPLLKQQHQKPPHLPLIPISTPEAYDSGHDSTPRASKHSGISRRAESGYHSVVTTSIRDSDESSFSSSTSRPKPIDTTVNALATIQKEKASKKKNRQDKSLCQWLRNPFTCTYPDTEGDVSDF